jgi:hypothetical protein
MSYVIAIPSYQRYSILEQKTLNMLNKYHIPKKKIYVFVADLDEKKLYQDALNSELYGHLIVGKKGLKNQRNFITNYFPEGQEILQLDDDISELKILANKITNNSDFSKFQQTQRKKTKKKHIKPRQKYTQSYRKQNFLKPLTDLDKFVTKAFQTLRDKHLYLWGIYPINNPYFMTQHITTDLRLIVGPVWGKINRYDEDLVLTLDEKEDVERTLQHYLKDNGVLRFNNLSAVTTYYKTPGGMQAHQRDRKKDALESALYLHKKYPELTKLYLEKKSGYAEVKLKDYRNI